MRRWLLSNETHRDSNCVLVTHVSPGDEHVSELILTFIFTASQ